MALGNENTFCNEALMDKDFYCWMDLSCRWLVRQFGIDGVPGMEAHHWNYEHRAKPISPV